MANSNSFSRLLILNGQPILFKNDGLNQTQSLGADILQQAIDDVASNDSISAVINCNNDDTIESDQNIPICIDETNTGRSNYVTVLSSDTNSDETSPIRLTLEQAAELGLHFTINSMDQMLEINTIGGKEDAVTETSDHNVFSIPLGLCNQQNSELSNKLDSTEMSCSIEQNVDILNKTNENNDYLSPISSLDPPQNQQLSLVPQIINGTVTYTLQLTNQPASQTNNNEFFRMDSQSLIGHNSNVGTESSLKLDLNNISTTTDLSYMKSPVDLVSNKFSNKHDCNSKERDNSDQSFRLVSCEDDNVTFLSLSDAIPVGTNVSNIVSHLNSSATHQCKLKISSGNIPENVSSPTSKVFVISNGGSSDCLIKPRDEDRPIHKSRSSVSVQSENTDFLMNKNSLAPIKSKLGLFGKYNACDSNISNLLINTPFETHSKSNFDFVEKDVNRRSPSKFQITSSSININENMDKLNVPSSLNTSRECGEENTDNCGDIRQTQPTIITPAGGDFPKEVSLALRRIPIKTNINKPLGSNENPIQLVQQGSTFHSMQALTEDHISKIKPILQENFESKIPSKNIVFDPASNTRIIYRIISPAEVSLRKQDEFPRRRGRPKKVRPADSQADEGIEGVPPPKKVFPRTRSGRLSRPPKHMVRDYKHIRRPELDDSDGGFSDYQSEMEDDSAALPASAPVDLLPGLVDKTKNQKRNISAGNLCPTCGKVYLGYVRMKRHFDKYPDHGSIEYLNTIRNSNPDSEAENLQLDGQNGLWKKGAAKKKGKGRNNGFFKGDKRTRLKEALEWCQNKDIVDIAGPSVASALSLWELLLLRVDCVKQDSQVAALYKELQELLCKLREMAHRLFRPLDHPLPPGTKHVTVQVEDEMMTGLLNLPCGVYLASDEDLKESAHPTAKSLPEEEPQVNSPLLLIEKEETENTLEDTSSKMTIDEVPQSFLLPSEEMICDSDDRGLVNVDDIVSEQLENLTGSQSSSVDELMKGLNELEQRNKLEADDDLMEEFSIVSQTNHVSASTEDLMKSLEHFDTGLNNPDAPSSLDRDTFDRVTNVDTLDFEVLSREFHSNNR